MHNNADAAGFYELTPERILNAVEFVGVRCTGRFFALNSMENRVFQVEIETDRPDQLSSRWEAWRVAKFYRPGRWSREQILEEHRFILESAKEGVPAVAPLEFPESGETLNSIGDSAIMFAVWPRAGGRTLDEIDDKQLERIGRLIARLHIVGLKHPAESRLKLNADTYGRNSLQYLLQHGFVPENMRVRYAQAVEAICSVAEGYLRGVPLQRVHGDLHGGNILWDREQCALVDFDDMVMGPAVQDLWLITPGRDDESLRRREILLAGYEQMKMFDRTQLALVETLRSLRIIYFNAWIARRWEDPAFKYTFCAFGTAEYWRDQLVSVEEQLNILRGGVAD